MLMLFDRTLLLHFPVSVAMSAVTGRSSFHVDNLGHSFCYEVNPHITKLHCSMMS